MRDLTVVEFAQRLPLTIEPAGNAVGRVFDERDQLFRRTDGATAAPVLALMAATGYGMELGRACGSTAWCSAPG